MWRYSASTRAEAGTGVVMTVLRIILGDQLSLDLSALHDIDPDRDVVLMMEVMEESTHVRHHKQKIVLVLSAMRHFAETLRQRGLTVDYVRLDAPDNTGSFTTEIRADPCAASTLPHRGHRTFGMAGADHDRWLEAPPRNAGGGPPGSSLFCEPGQVRGLGPRATHMANGTFLSRNASRTWIPHGRRSAGGR